MSLILHPSSGAMLHAQALERLIASAKALEAIQNPGDWLKAYPSHQAVVSQYYQVLAEWRAVRDWQESCQRHSPAHEGVPRVLA